MTDTHFLPWLRTGLATLVDDPGAVTDGDSLVMTPTVEVVSDDGTHPVDGPEIRLRGPGDVIGLNVAEIKRRDPAPDAVDAETNYFCSVEFFAPDLPWRYSPAAADGDVLAPWIVLVVVEPGDGVVLTTPKGRLPVLHVDQPEGQLPDLADSWAWAHVQAATSLTGGVAAAYASDPDAFSSRLLCPRRLRPGASYLACLVPAFKSGQLAGLGFDPEAATGAAWADGAVDLPVYDSWTFRAGDRADFKQLAKRITPGELPPDVGFRDLDLSDTGTGMTPLSSRATFVGAMHAPVSELVHWHDRDDQRTFQDEVRERLVTEPPRRSRNGYDPLRDDPVVAPPAYGAPQRGSNVVPDTSGVVVGPGRRTVDDVSLPVRPPGWFEELNIAPHHRAVAAIGADVVRADQEALMAAAWEQGRAAIGVNRSLNRGRLVQETARQAEGKWNALPDADAVSIAAPAFVQMRTGGVSMQRRIEDAGAPGAYVGAAFRRLGRAGGPLATRADVDAAREPAIAITRTLVASVTEGDQAPDPLSIAFRTRYLPAGMDVGAIADPAIVAARHDPALGPERVDGLDRARRTELRRRAATVPVLTASAAGGGAPGRPPRRVARPDGERLGPFLDPDVELDLPTWTFEAARPVVSGRLLASSPTETSLGFDLAGEVRAAVRPEDAVVTAIRSRVVVPADVWPVATAIPTRVGLQPRFTDPMYRRVQALSVDYLVPGVGAVPNNVAALLEVNPAYVDAFLVGVNHEMSRELRWREYPADLRQTWFQHFFESLDPPGSVDIPPIADWDPDQALGQGYDPPNASGGADEPGLVLLLKADLVRKFPDVRVYAVPAKVDGDVRSPDLDEEPRSPTFVGSFGRGTNVYGFDNLTESEARGDGGGDGWFFVLEEEPRAMRFGLDNGGKAGELPSSTWNTLGWKHLAEDDGATPWFCAIDPPNADFDGATRDQLTWGDDAAVMAAITFRRPVQVFMHATAMLPGGSDD